ncbi:hypothetical protein ACIP3B_10890 [Streptomyces anulatus]|uniref:hypothetical protein n=1 Tax=Streptomyces anulatus TaxID=1892 RepID=UPI0033C4AE6E
MEAAPGSGSVPEAIDRIVSAMVHVGDRVLFLFASTGEELSRADASIVGAVDEILVAEIRRGQQGGELDSTVPAQWIQRMVWSTVYTCLHATGDGRVARHGVDDLIRWTLRGAISALRGVSVPVGSQRGREAGYFDVRRASEKQLPQAPCHAGRTPLRSL